MRTLLVDNYDSFTYNLFHYLAEVSGTEPEVIRNDDPSFRMSWLGDFDSIVISPGPGSPAHPKDFGICEKIINETSVPLLGVCLGHQGLALLHGATVTRAPEPRHGRLSPILHTGRDVFAGLPSPFEAVRYHSLAVRDVPPELEAIAWTPDGVLMGLRHRRRPMWGVQFHPESISSEHGRQLLGNFVELAGRHRARSRPAVQVAAPADPTVEVAQGAEGSGPEDGLRVVTAVLPTECDDEVAFQALFGNCDNAFWLDSSRPDNDLGRFSIMGCACGPRAQVATADVWSGTVSVRTAGRTSVIEQGFLTWLDEQLRRRAVPVPQLPFDFALGWIGYLGYELKAECDGDRVHRSAQPDAAMIFADRAVVLDHATSTTYLLSLAQSDGSDSEAAAWLSRTAETLRQHAEKRLPLTAMPSHDMPVRLRHDRASYVDLISECREAIAAGETYEVCLTNMAEAQGSLDPWQCYLALRRANPAPFAALLRFGALSVLSTSPERFLRVSRDGVAEAKPIKGTRPRGATPEEDDRLRQELRTNEKDNAENLMIVDLVRNDLGSVADVGSVCVPVLFDVETYATVHQLVSTVRARLRPGVSAVEAVRAAFPGGSMTGAPKIRTMQIIDRLEQGPRGVYSGAIGYFSLSGAADLSIVIRTAVIDSDRLTYGVGGAIIALSDPDAEFEETAVKATPLLRLLGADFPGRDTGEALRVHVAG